MPAVDLSLVKGLIPLIDPRAAKVPYVVDGRNFLVDFKGPRAIFGNTLSTFAELTEPEYCEEFLIEGVIHIFTATGVYLHDTLAQVFYPAVVFGATYAEKWPWSGVKLGNAWYFCKKGLPGLLQYDLNTGAWSAISPSGLPTNPVSVCKAQGRLIVGSDSTYAWSAIEDGTDFTPDIATGSGFQATSLIGGTMLAVKQTADGFFVYTTSGIIRVYATGAAIVFAHRVLTNTPAPFNPFCVIEHQTYKHIYLSRTGLFITDQNEPTKFQPLQAEYFAQNVLPFADLTDFGLFRMSYTPERDWLFISQATESVTALYQHAFVFNIPRGEWGNFTRNHYAIGRYAFVNNGAGFYDWGFVCDNGRLYKFDNTQAVETWPVSEDTNAILWTSHFEQPPRLEGSVLIFTSRMRITAYDFTRYKNFKTGFYTLLNFETISKTDAPTALDLTPFTDVTYEDWLAAASETEDWLVEEDAEDWSGDYLNYVFRSAGYFSSQVQLFQLAEVPSSFAGLNSFVTIGPIRFTEPEFLDQSSQLNQVALGMFAASPAVYEDWSVMTGAEDWSTFSNLIEDWGGYVIDNYTYTFTVFSTNTQVSDQSGVYETTPELARTAGSTKYWTLHPPSTLWHYIHLAAMDVGQTYHAQFLEADGILTGRI